MKIRGRRLLLALLLLPPILLLAVYLIADYWLESAGGRRTLERTLASRIGLVVRLSGEFELMLLPSVGASGTNLVVSGDSGGPEIARSREYEISVALKPLIERRLLIESIRLTGGVVRPGHYAGSKKAVGDDGESVTFLPEVRNLILRDFRIILPGGEGKELSIRELAVQDFVVGKATPFSLDLAKLGLIRGEFLWSPGKIVPDLDIVWDHRDLGLAQLTMTSDASGLGSLRADLDSNLLEEIVSFTTQFQTHPEGVRLADLRLESAGQEVRGDGCLLLKDPPGLRLNLSAGRIDLDAVTPALPQPGSTATGMPLDLNVVFRADELHSGGAVVRGAILRLGAEPDCSALAHSIP